MKRSVFLKSLAAIAGAASSKISFGKVAEPIAAAKKSLRIAHLTDMHLLPRKEAIEGSAKVVEMVKKLNPLPDLILNGGDCVMDALHTEKAKVKDQWKIYNEQVKSQLKIPIISTLGNHDVYGWDDETLSTDKDYGKQWALDELQMKARYYSLEMAHWKFIVLDSIHLGDNNKGYKGVIDDEQKEWLTGELDKSKDKNVCVLSHIPLMSSCPLFHSSTNNEQGYTVPSTWMVRDAVKLKELFYANKNVKLCLSGHTHMQDQVNFMGMSFLNAGAVSGNWWDGVYMDFAPTFSVIDLHDDGKFEHTYINY